MKQSELLRVAVGVIGALFLLGGVLLFVEPSLATIFPFGPGTVGGVGVLLAILGLFMARVRWKTRLEDARFPNPEYPPPANVPGSDIDRMLVELTELRHGTLEYRERIETRLREAAIAVIAYRDDCTAEEAERQVAEGTWSDDPVATSFFTGTVAAGDQPSFVDRMFGGSGRNEYVERVERTVDAIVRRGAIESTDTTAESAQESQDDGFLTSILGRSGGSEDDSASIQKTEWNPDWVWENIDAPRNRVHELGSRETHHWLGVSLFGLIAVGLGVVASQPGLVLAGTIGIAYAAYSRTATEPQLEALKVERTLSDENPQPGDEVHVRVRIENAGGSVLSDLRIVDMVPDHMIVTEGAPRLGTALRPGKSVTFTYTLVAERGKYSWPVYIAGRDYSGSIERDAFVIPDVTLSCIPTLKTLTDMPVRSQTSQYSGGVATKVGGSGLEFFSVRDYRPGDEMKRINWRQLARTGELSTIEFREEKAATIVLLFDGRQSAYAAPEPTVKHAVDRAVEAGGEVFGSLYDNGDLVGLAAFDTVPCWLSPGAGSEQLERARLLFAEHPAISSIPPDQLERQGGYVDPLTHVRRQLPTSSQIVLFSPICDDYGAEVARRLNSSGHLVTVVSPNPTADNTLGQRLARVERMIRINNLREKGIRVLDWQPHEQLTLELQRAQMRWAQ